MDDLQPNCRYFTIEEFNKKYGKHCTRLSTLHVNIRSIKNKLDAFETFLQSLCVKFDIIAISETWLTKEDVPPHIEGYKCEVLTRKQRRGGGTAVYVNTNLRHQVIEPLNRVDEHIESLFIKVVNTVIGVLYRPPSGNTAEFLQLVETVLSNIGSTSSPFIILGDVNIDTGSDNPPACEFRELLEQYASSNLILLPTRVTSTSATSLDVCITNLDASSVSAGIIS